MTHRPRTLTAAEEMRLAAGFVVQPLVTDSAVRLLLFASLIGVTGAAAFWAISVRGRDFSRDPD